MQRVYGFFYAASVLSIFYRDGQQAAVYSALLTADNHRY